MGLICFFVAICMIFYLGNDAKNKYNREADMARIAYIEEHEDEFHKFNIQTKQAINRIAGEKSSDFRVLGCFFWTSLILGIIAIVVMGNIEDKGNNSGIISGMISLTWGYLSSIVASMISTGNIKNHVVGRLESTRCPHCSAPLSYFETDIYTDSEMYFQKKVSKYDSELNMRIPVTENWMRYKEHHIYTCDYCCKKDDVVKEKEEKLDKESLLDVLGKTTA